MEILIERIHEIIKTENLRERTKKPNKVHRRWFIFSYLRKNNYVLREIAELFGMNHATIIHGITQAELFERAKDEMYLIDTKDLFEEFKNKKIKLKERNLIQDIMESKNLYDLTKIKRRLQNNVYKFSDKNDLY
jgi:transposase